MPLMHTASYARRFDAAHAVPTLLTPFRHYSHRSDATHTVPTLLTPFRRKCHLKGDFFAGLSEKKHWYPSTLGSARCFICSATGKTHWRFDSNTLVRRCDQCRDPSSRKKRKAESEEIESKSDRRKAALLFVSAAFVTGLSFSALSDFFLLAHLDMPVSKNEFYEYQPEVIKFVSGCADGKSWNKRF